LTTGWIGGALGTVTLVIVATIDVAVLTSSAVPEAAGGPGAPGTPAAPAEPVLPLQAPSSTLSSIALTLVHAKARCNSQVFLIYPSPCDLSALLRQDGTPSFRLTRNNWEFCTVSH
jgi:hypothetical protein